MGMFIILNAAGFDVAFDKDYLNSDGIYEQTPEVFMKQINSCDIVLAVCTELYHTRSFKTSGVRTEVDLIMKRAEQTGKAGFYVPLLVHGNNPNFPKERLLVGNGIIRSSIYIDLRERRHFVLNMWRILDHLYYISSVKLADSILLSRYCDVLGELLDFNNKLTPTPHYEMDIQAFEEVKIKYEERKLFLFNIKQKMIICESLTIELSDKNIERLLSCARNGQRAELYQLLLIAEFKKNPEVLNNLATMYFNGTGVVKNIEESIRFYNIAASQGDASSQYNLGLIYAHGWGVVQDDVEAVKWYRLASDQGHTRASGNLVNIMYGQARGIGERGQEEIAVASYKCAADHGDANAQYNLGIMYANGRGVVQDDVEAVKWYRLASDQGFAKAQNSLGFMYANGRGVETDTNETIRFYILAAEQGYATAQNNLGCLYRDGIGVNKDNEEAVKWYSLAANQEYAFAQYNLGEMYFRGIGIAKNTEEAMRLYRLAADQGCTSTNNLSSTSYVSLIETEIDEK